MGNDERNNNNDNDFRFVCINNNDNENNVVVINETTPIPPTPPDLSCEECFAANSTLQTAIEEFLAELGPFEFTSSELITTDGIAELFWVGFPTETIEQLCAQIKNAVEELGVPLSDEIIKKYFTFILGEEFEAGIDTLIECLLEKGLIVDRTCAFQC